MDPDGIQTIAARMLGEALRADRCLYVTYDWSHQRITVEEDWRREGLSSLAGVYPASDLRQSVKALFPEGATAVFRDVGLDLPGELADMAQRLEVRALLGVPLYHAGELAAAVFVGMSEDRREWTSDEVDIVQQVATLTRTAVEAASINKREHAIATELQAALQPPLPEAVPGLDLAVFYQSALHGATVGGDFYDVFPVGPGTYAFVVGDLSGKGLAAAAQVATVRNMLRFALHNAADLVAAVTALNRTIAENSLLPGFATMFVGCFDEADRTFSYVNCGQEAGLLLRGGGGEVELLMPTGPTLGIDAGAEYATVRAHLSTGDAIALFTDGYTEAGPDRDAMLGVQGLAQYVRDMGKVENAGHLVSRLTQRALDWAKGQIRDDMCLLAAIVR